MKEEEIMEEREIQQMIEDETHIVLEKLPGSKTCRCSMEASSAAAALNGISVLIREYAAKVGMPELRVLAILAAVMAAPTIRQEAAEQDV